MTYSGMHYQFYSLLAVTEEKTSQLCHISLSGKLIKSKLRAVTSNVFELPLLIQRWRCICPQSNIGNSGCPRLVPLVIAVVSLHILLT
jgi:hypothetical protein